MKFNQFLWVFLGGGLGSVLRLQLSLLISRFDQQQIPLATLLANVTACIILAIIVRFNSPVSETMRVFALVGFCGGLSTFSTFSMETISMLKFGQVYGAIGNVVLNVLLCFGVVYLIVRK